MSRAEMILKIQEAMVHMSETQLAVLLDFVRVLEKKESAELPEIHRAFLDKILKEDEHLLRRLAD